MRICLFVLYSLIAILFIGCKSTPRSNLRSELLDDFRMDVFDSLQIGTGKIVQMLNKNDAVVVYLGNGECSECVADFNVFNEKYLDAGVGSPCVYIMSGIDTLNIDYFFKTNKIRKNRNAILVYDTTCCFSNLMPQYMPNQIFILKKDSLVRRISKLDINNKTEWSHFFSLLVNPQRNY